MFCKVPYLKISEKHRPYLEIIFANSVKDKLSSRTLALVDSGADQTVIPFSLGLQIDLTIPTEQERLASVSGVGGDLNYIERECQIGLANRRTNKIYIFNERVWWIYPDASTLNERQKLTRGLLEAMDLQKQTLPNTPLSLYFQEEQKRISEQIQSMDNRLEVNVLLGRPFFNNFEYIQFFHKDRSLENKCFFNYLVAKDKPAEILTLASPTQTDQIRAASSKTI